MKLVSYLNNYEERVAIFYENNIYDLQECATELKIELPSRMEELLKGEEALMNEAKKVNEAVKDGKVSTIKDTNNIKIIAPVPHPNSCRDAYAFRQHVATARRNRGVEMIPEFDQFPVFYLTNHNAIFGPGEIVLEKDHFLKLDFELEAAVVIGKRGKNIKAEEADKYIAGYMIMNDLSARQLQMEEMKLNLGPAKGKDFATVIGPWFVTSDELEEYKIETPKGNKYDLRMTAKHNGKQISDGNMKDMDYTFAEIIERVSYGVNIFPGDVIGSGTVGTGCYLELNGTWRIEAEKEGKDFTPTWIQENDEMELEIQGLGILKNKFVKAKEDYSILDKKRK